MAASENWMSANWRPLCGIVYLLICVVDFVGMPIWMQITNGRYPPDRIVEIVSKLEGAAAQVEGIRALRQQQTWEPVTLMGSGLFHVAFGAILGAAAWTRGTEKIERARGAQPPTLAEVAENLGAGTERSSRGRSQR